MALAIAIMPRRFREALYRHLTKSLPESGE
jgi:hypothetical protein